LLLSTLHKIAVARLAQGERPLKTTRTLKPPKSWHTRETQPWIGFA